ncbi:MAG: hypothetical protein IJU96_07500 [Clostridia bacterium]|nr:hypothetical protein [Clostridia bacterium]
MKKWLSAALLLVLLLSVLAGCSAVPRKKTALTIGKAEIDNEVFAYYFDAAYSEAQKSGADLNDTAALTERAVDLCCGYVATTTQYEQMSMKLDAESRKAISENSEECWRLYGGHYTKAGVTKQTIGKIEAVAQYRTALLLYYFGEGSEYEVTEEEIEYYFDQNYVEFEAIVGYLTTQDENGETIPLTEQEADELRSSFLNKRDRMKNGSTLAQVNEDIEVSPTFVSVNNSAYPEGFLKQVSSLPYNEPTLMETEEYLFLVVRLDAKKGDVNNYTNYRTRYIDALRGETLDEMLIETAKEYPIERRDRVIEKAAEKVLDARRTKE